MTSTQEILRVVLIGCGATLIMDIWLMFLKRMGVQTLNFAFIGRWVGHLFRGRVTHASIGKASSIENETLLGWLTHYAVGIAFAFLMVNITGTVWISLPSPGIAILIGLSTVVFPLLVMQPAMGLGFAALRTATPIKNCIRSLVNHGVFGFGLYVSASVLEVTSR